MVLLHLKGRSHYPSDVPRFVSPLYVQSNIFLGETDETSMTRDISSSRLRLSPSLTAGE